MLPDWTLAPVVAALQTMRGMALVNAGDADRRTGRPLALCQSAPADAYLGLVPSEHSSGASIKRGGLTKAGNSAARRLLIEAAWTYRFPPGSAANCCSGRRSSPSRSARSPGKRSCGCVRAIANLPAAANRPTSSGRDRREPAGFIWAIARRCRRRRVIERAA